MGCLDLEVKKIKRNNVWLLSTQQQFDSLMSAMCRCTAVLKRI